MQYENLWINCKKKILVKIDSKILICCFWVHLASNKLLLCKTIRLYSLVNIYIYGIISFNVWRQRCTTADLFFHILIDFLIIILPKHIHTRGHFYIYAHTKSHMNFQFYILVLILLCYSRMYLNKSYTEVILILILLYRLRSFFVYVHFSRFHKFKLGE